MDAEFCVDIFQIVLHGSFRYGHNGSNFLVREPPLQKVKDNHFVGCETRGARGVAHSLR